MRIAMLELCRRMVGLAELELTDSSVAGMLAGF